MGSPYAVSGSHPRRCASLHEIFDEVIEGHIGDIVSRPGHPGKIYA
jgi:hypothetical protein